MVRLKNWIPNIFTLSNLTLGFFSILLSLHGARNPGTLALAGGLILLAFLCDGLDGFAARLLNASSEVGAQLDSLADLTTFGIAPGVLMYSMLLQDFQVAISPGANISLGMLLAAIFPICAAYRLARFNVDHSPNSFRGLPSPAAGAVVALMPLAFSGELSAPAYLLEVIFIISAFLMVSTIKYAKPQASALSWFSPFRLTFLLLFIIALLVFIGFRYSQEMAFVGLYFVIGVYVISGFVSLLIQLIQKYRI